MQKCNNLIFHLSPYSNVLIPRSREDPCIHLRADTLHHPVQTSQQRAQNFVNPWQVSYRKIDLLNLLFFFNWIPVFKPIVAFGATKPNHICIKSALSISQMHLVTMSLIVFRSATTRVGWLLRREGERVGQWESRGVGYVRRTS
jgi:hypothetical protein